MTIIITDSSSPEHKLGVFGLPGPGLPGDDDGLAHLQDLHVPVRFISWSRDTQEAAVRLDFCLKDTNLTPNNPALIKLQNRFYFV